LSDVFYESILLSSFKYKDLPIADLVELNRKVTKQSPINFYRRKIINLKIVKPVYAGCYGGTMCGTILTVCYCSQGGGLCSTGQGGLCMDEYGDIGTCNCTSDLNCVVAFPSYCSLNGTSCGVNCGTAYGINLDCDPERYIYGSCGCTTVCNSPHCGQSDTCGGTCANTDNGAPAAPTIISPNGTSGSPTLYNLVDTSSIVNLSWSSNSSLTDYYQVYVLNSSNSTVWSNTNTTVLSIGSSGYVPGVYHWHVRAVNTSCGTDTGNYSADGYFRVNAPPTFSSLIIKNVDGGVVAGESGGTTLRNHICQTTFQNSSSSKKVIFEASVNDLDGATDIDTATLTWNGRNYSMTKGYSSGTGATMVVTVDYSIFSATVTDVYDLFVTVTDIYGASSGSVDTDRDWKVWDCYIPTSGTLYNGSAGQACFTGLGFSVPIDVGVSFDSLIFNNNNVSVRVFTVSKPSNYGGNYIVWGEIYHPRINKGTLYNENGDLLATGRVTRITDLGAGTAAQCPSNEFVIGNGIQALISAYSVNPEAQIDFSFIRDQEAWYQVVGAGVKSRNRLEYGVPVTAPLESKFLTLSSATNGNGLVSATDFNNINGNNNNEFGSPNNWYVLRNTNDLDIYNYNYFYNNFFVKAGVGVTGTDWAGKPENGIYLVKNSLNITSDFVLVDTTKTMMVIVNGDITIQPNVTRLDGIYIADGSINVGGISDNQLNINGMLYAGSDVKLYRSFTDKTDNNTTPAVKVNYSPGLIFNLPPKILRVLSGWKEE